MRIPISLITIKINWIIRFVRRTMQLWMDRWLSGFSSSGKFSMNNWCQFPISLYHREENISTCHSLQTLYATLDQGTSKRFSIEMWKIQDLCQEKSLWMLNSKTSRKTEKRSRLAFNLEFFQFYNFIFSLPLAARCCLRAKVGKGLRANGKTKREKINC